MGGREREEVRGCGGGQNGQNIVAGVGLSVAHNGELLVKIR